MLARVPGALPQATVNVAFGQNSGPKMRNFEVNRRPPASLLAADSMQAGRSVARILALRAPHEWTARLGEPCPLVAASSRVKKSSLRSGDSLATNNRFFVSSVPL